MPFYAKPSGGYSIGSTEGTANINAAYDYLNTLGFTKESVAGMLGNSSAESGLNPWRWQDDSVSMTSNYKGYGLFQFTPAYAYEVGFEFRLPLIVKYPVESAKPSSNVFV